MNKLSILLSTIAFIAVSGNSIGMQLPRKGFDPQSPNSNKSYGKDLQSQGFETPRQKARHQQPPQAPKRLAPVLDVSTLPEIDGEYPLREDGVISELAQNALKTPTQESIRKTPRTAFDKTKNEVAQCAELSCLQCPDATSSGDASEAFPLKSYEEFLESLLADNNFEKDSPHSNDLD